MESCSGDKMLAYFGMHLEIALKAPINDRMAVQVFGCATDASADMRWVLGERVPFDQSQPKTVTFAGQITVFCGDMVRLFSRKRSKTLCQFVRRSGMVLAPMNISSAIIKIKPSCKKSPKIRDINSCKYSELPGIPIGGRK